MHIRPATAAPASPPPCNITAARQTKEDFHGLLMGTAIRDEPDKPATAKANPHAYRTKTRKTEQEGPSSHPVTVALEPVPQARQKDRKRKKKQSERQQKHPKTGHRKPHPRQIRSPRPEYLSKTRTQSCIYTVYHTLRLSQTENHSLEIETHLDLKRQKKSTGYAKICIQKQIITSVSF